ncbi:zinc finger, PHD-type containing protein [Tanacetum coccineum]
MVGRGCADDAYWKVYREKERKEAKKCIRLGLVLADGFSIRLCGQPWGVRPPEVQYETMVYGPSMNIPARSSLSGWSGQGYKACPTCNEDTPSVRVLSKTAYVGHRRFLKKPHKWRRSLEFNGQTDNTNDPT